MNKSNPLNHKLLSKTNIALICVLGMVVGFLLSRAVLSGSIFVFGIVALWDVPPRKWFKDKWWLLGAGWIALYALSYFWTDDKANWHTRFDVKLPILLLPLAFSFLPPFNVKQLRVFTFVASLFFLASAAYSLSFYLSDPKFYSEQYVYSHMLPTLVYGDHIRYSLALVLFVIWCMYIIPALSNKWLQWFTGITIFLLVFYLHLLAARTGLIIWYLFIVAYCIRLLFTRKPLAGLAIVVSLGVGAFLAVNYIPTLEKRVWYVQETIRSYQRGEESTGLSDMGRLISYRLANKLIVEHSLTGVGAGDMQNEMERLYASDYPQVAAEYKLLPHNQFMIVCLGCGVPALILFIIWAFIPLSWLKNNKAKFYLFITWLSLLLALMVEPMLEVQFGVFVFMFFLLWQRHTSRYEL